MFCPKCGTQVPDDTKFCPSCGASLSGEQQVADSIGKVFESTEKELGSAINDVSNSIKGAPYHGERLKDDRGLFSYIILSVITCGIYGYYFIYKMAHDVNIACEGDGNKTGGLVAFIFLSFITCGIYAWYWYYSLGNRLAENAPRYGLSFQENGTTVLLWFLFGAFLCGIGPFIAMNILIKNSNRLCYAYNKTHNLYNY